MTIVDFGALAFGVVVGWICYRTIRRKSAAAITDIGAVIAAVGGAAVTGLFETAQMFAWYSIGLAAGFFLYLLAAILTAGKGQRIAVWMGD